MRQPPCRYFGKCGGCTTQHLEYGVQLQNKAKSVSSLLKIPLEQIKVFFGNELGYRNRMDFIFHPEGIGLRSAGKWDSIINIGNCPISNEILNRLLEEVRDFFTKPDAFSVNSRKGTFRYAVIRATTINSCISFILNEDSRQTAEAIELVKDFASKTAADNVVIGYIPNDKDESTTPDFFVVKGSEYLEEQIASRVFEFHSQSFFQNNTAMASKMADYIKSLLANNKGTLLDLYAGVGIFGIICSGLFDEVKIVENSPESIQCAKRNIKSNNIFNAEAFEMDAKAVSKLQLKKPLCAITDPPRSGMELKAIERLLAFNPQKIIYISCNPQQLGKEMHYFMKAGYKISSCALFDLFPQTNHMEVVAEMDK